MTAALLDTNAVSDQVFTGVPGLQVEDWSV